MNALPPQVEQHYIRVRAVQKEVARLRASAAYRGAAELLLTVLDRALTGLGKEFTNLASGSEAASRTAARYSQVASVLHDCLQFVQGSDEDHTPSSLVEPLETLARPYMPDCKLLVRGSFKGGLGAYWCEFFTPALRRLLTGLPGGAPLSGQLAGLVSLVFPAADRANLLMHAILGHELGHGFSHDRGIGDGLTVPVIADVGPILAQWPAPEQERFRRVVVGWLEELIADAFAVHVMGPAFYFASDDALRSAPPSESHPGGTFRLRLLRMQLEWRGYLVAGGDVGQWLSGHLAAVDAGQTQLPAGGGDAVLEGAEKCLEAFAQELFAVVRQQAQVDAFGPDRLESVSPHLVGRLRNLVPPDEVDGSPATLPDVLNAGWLLRLRRWEDFCAALRAEGDSELRFDALSKLNGLLLKALEYSAIRAHWVVG